MTPGRSILIAALAGVLLLGGCMRTTYRDVDAERASVPLLERGVRYRISSHYYRNPPQCAVIVTQESAAPKTDEPDKNAASADERRSVRRAVEAAVERNLSTRLPRVIGRSEKRQLERRLVLDIRDAGDRREFARRTRCKTAMLVRIHAVKDDYLVLWSQRGIGIVLELRDIETSKRLWIAHHESDRGDGGVPLSPFSLPFAVARAAMLKSDTEVYESIADDAVRRMMTTLPDMRFSKAGN